MVAVSEAGPVKPPGPETLMPSAVGENGQTAAAALERERAAAPIVERATTRTYGIGPHFSCRNRHRTLGADPERQCVEASGAGYPSSRRSRSPTRWPGPQRRIAGLQALFTSLGRMPILALVIPCPLGDGSDLDHVGMWKEREAAMADPLRVVHYLNQFFGGIGGEEHANVRRDDGRRRIRRPHLAARQQPGRHGPGAPELKTGWTCPSRPSRGLSGRATSTRAGLRRGRPSTEATTQTTSRTAAASATRASRTTKTGIPRGARLVWRTSILWAI